MARRSDDQLFLRYRREQAPQVLRLSFVRIHSIFRRLFIQDCRHAIVD
jgi:hypothetical protein